MRRSLALICALPAVFAISGCTFVRMAPEAQKVRVLRAAPEGCTRLGEISVEITDRVALYQRNALRVAEELETMARNEAAAMPATDIHPLGAVQDGRQKFAAWRCSR